MVYLPTCAYFTVNVGKYTIHGSYGTGISNPLISPAISWRGYVGVGGRLTGHEDQD